jgi:hypothetical protein
MNWWTRLFYFRRPPRVYAPMVVDLETGRVYVWDGSKMVDAGFYLARLS